MASESPSLVSVYHINTDSVLPRGLLSGPPCDFIAFLAVAQKLDISLLPITWQSARGLAGLGGTAKINQAHIDIQTTLAFKCVKDNDKHDDNATQIFRMLINEIVALSDPSIRKHPNILELQGICWDIPSDNEVWPVLVFEKSHFGDLRHFATLPVWMDLTMGERLKLCIDIGTAVADMHSNNIIHGDIKPENVLIFLDDAGGFSARVIDFGFSTQFANEDDRISVGRSRPWNAPENSPFHKFTLSQAKKMDVYSFGILCVWVLFEQYFTGSAPLPEEARWAQQSFMHMGRIRQTGSILEELKEADELLRLAQQLLGAEETLDRDKKSSLNSFLASALLSDPNSRHASLQQSLELLAPYRNHALTVEVKPNNQSELESSFEILPSLEELYEADYRVRAYLAKCFEKRLSLQGEYSSLNVDRNAEFQLALCYKIGFGVAQNEDKSQNILNNKEAQRRLENAINQHTTFPPKRSRATLITKLIRGGYLYSIHYMEDHQSHENWRKAEERLKQEIGFLEISFRNPEPMVILKEQLQMVYQKSSRWKEAEELSSQVMEIREAMLGKEHPDTLMSMHNLASTYSNQGRWSEAEKIELQLIETRKRLLGPEHIETLMAMSNLAVTYDSQGRWKEAEELEIQVMEARKGTMGKEHPYTLTSMSIVAAIYQDQGRWREAEALTMEVIEIRKKVLGEKHPRTLLNMGNLASIYRDQGRWRDSEAICFKTIEIMKEVLGDNHTETLRAMGNLSLAYLNQGRWKEAEELGVEVMMARKKALGEEHPDTLTSMANLASTYRDQGKWKKDEELSIKIIELSKRVLGEKHPNLLKGLANLATALWNQGRWIEAEELEVRILDARKGIQGEEHPSTLTSMANLASTYWSRGRLTEAKELAIQVLEMRKKVLGEQHPNTLMSITSLASIYQREGLYKEAEDLLLEAIVMDKMILGEEHPYTLTSMANLATSYRSQWRWKEAEDIIQQVIEKRKKVLGDSHPDTLTVMHDLVTTYSNQGRWKEAEELELHVIETRRMVLREKHPDTLTSQEYLALIYQNLGRWNEAEGIEVEVMKSRMLVLGKEDRDTLRSMHNLASTYWNQRRWKEAEELTQQVMEDRERALGLTDLDTLTSISNLASMYWNQGRLQEAEDLDKIIEERKKL